MDLVTQHRAHILLNVFLISSDWTRCPFLWKSLESLTKFWRWDSINPPRNSLPQNVLAFSQSTWGIFSSATEEFYRCLLKFKTDVYSYPLILMGSQNIMGEESNSNNSWVNFIFSSVTESCLTLCDPMNCSMPGLPVHHQLPEST